MSTARKLVFADGEVYHVFNRGVNKMPIFNSFKEYSRMIELLNYYKHGDLKLRFSHYSQLSLEQKNNQKICDHKKIIEILAYCLMPNHFHILLKQLRDGGVSRFISNISNSYTRYFNTKNQRSGYLIQNTFKAVRVESDEQLIHLSRYIHINPVISFITSKDEIFDYKWSSIKEYLGIGESFCDSSIVLGQFADSNQYKDFLLDYVDEAKRRKELDHLLLED